MKYYLFFIIIAIFSYFYFDKSIAYYFSTNLDSHLHHIVNIFTKLGDSFYYIIISLFIYIITKSRFIEKTALLVFSSTVISGILINIIKIIFARYRPPMLLEHHLYGFKTFDIGYLVNSFPSGHATTAFSVYVSLALVFPKFKYFFIGIAIFIALSRVLLCVHYLSDVMIGGVIGTATAIFLYDKIFFQKTTI